MNASEKQLNILPAAVSCISRSSPADAYLVLTSNMILFQRSLLSGGSISQTAEVYVEFSGAGGGQVEKGDSRPSDFSIVPERVKAAADPGKRLPKFKIEVGAVFSATVVKICIGVATCPETKIQGCTRLQLSVCS